MYIFIYTYAYIFIYIKVKGADLLQLLELGLYSI